MTIHHLKLFAVALIVFLITDMLWLGLIMKSYYLEQYQDWLRLSRGELQPIWWATVLVYLFFALGMMVFILPLAKGSLLYAALYGACLGAIIFGVYDFTCLALFKNWPVGMAFIDLAWGMVLWAWCSVVVTWVQGHLH